MRWMLLALAVPPSCMLTPSCLLAPAVPRVPSPMLMGGKGDGKRRRPPQADVSVPPTPPPAEASANNPSRIQSGGAGASHTISVRKQIAMVKAMERAAAPSKPAVRTSFRKKEKGSSNRGRGDNEVVDASGDWRALPVLFVDGYNVVNAWPRLKKRFLKGQLQAAREMLLEDVASYAVERYNATVVFDANGSPDNPGEDREEEYAGGLVRVVYAHQSADEYIEQQTRALKGEGVSVTTATSDMAVATACNVHGAVVVSAGWLVTELKGSRNAEPALLADFNKRQARAAGRGPTIWDTLDPAMREELDKRLEVNANAGLSKRQIEAMELIRREREEEEAEAQRRRQLLRRDRAKKAADGGAADD